MSNGEYAIDFYDFVRILFYPHLKQNNGKTVMDIICIPQPERYPLQNNYKINELMEGANYLYGDSTIERALSYTSCIRFSLDQSITEDIPKFSEIIDFINYNIHTILKKQQELD